MSEPPPCTRAVSTQSGAQSHWVPNGPPRARFCLAATSPSGGRGKRAPASGRGLRTGAGAGARGPGRPKARAGVCGGACPLRDAGSQTPPLPSPHGHRDSNTARQPSGRERRAAGPGVKEGNTRALSPCGARSGGSAATPAPDPEAGRRRRDHTRRREGPAPTGRPKAALASSGEGIKGVCRLRTPRSSASPSPGKGRSLTSAKWKQRRPALWAPGVGGEGARGEAGLGRGFLGTTYWRDASEHHGLFGLPGSDRTFQVSSVQKRNSQRRYGIGATEALRPAAGCVRGRVLLPTGRSSSGT